VPGEISVCCVSESWPSAMKENMLWLPSRLRGETLRGSSQGSSGSPRRGVTPLPGSAARDPWRLQPEGRIVPVGDLRGCASGSGGEVGRGPDRP